jgi:hypothetical protein
MVMGFLNSIKEKISEKTLANLSSYLGEKDADVSSGLNLSLNTFMSGLLSSSKSEADAQKIIKVLEDGGHTGNTTQEELADETAVIMTFFAKQLAS